MVGARDVASTVAAPSAPPGPQGPTLGHPVATFRRVRTSTRLACALTAAWLVGCTSDPAPRVITPLVVGEKPEPPPPLEDVVGTVDEVTVADLSAAGSGLHPDGSAADAGTPPDPAAVDAVVAAATRWVDAHLTAVQAGQEGLVAGAGLEGDPTAAAAALANPAHRITDARYTVTVGAVGAPEWVRVGAVVDREDGEMTVTFVLVPDGTGIALVAVQTGDGTPAPPAEPGDGS